MSYYFKKGEKKKVYYNKVKEILETLESKGKIEFIDKDPTIKLTWRDVYKVDYFSTKEKWVLNKSKNVCYQFDGKSHKCKNMKNDNEEKEIIKILKDSGFNPIRLGGRIFLKDCIKYLSNCEFFIGVESGFAHIASSVGTPIFMIMNGRTYKEIKDCHENRELLLCTDYLGSMSLIKAHSKNIECYNERKSLIK